MKSKTINLILFLLTVVVCGAFYLQHQSEDVLSTGAIMLVLMLVAMLVRGFGKPFRNMIPVLISCWTLLYVILPHPYFLMGIDSQLPQWLGVVLDTLVANLSEAIIPLVMTLVLGLFVKSRTNAVIIIFRYLAVGVLLRVLTPIIAYAISPSQVGINVLAGVIGFLWLVSLVCELRGCVQKKPAPALRKFLGRVLMFLLVVLIEPTTVLLALYELQEKPAFLLGGLSVLGIMLLVTDNDGEEWNPTTKVYESDVLGVMTLSWCLYAVLAGWYGDFGNMLVLLAGAPVALFVYEYITAFCAAEDYDLNAFGKKLGGRGFLFYYWFWAVVAMLTAGRTVNLRIRYFALLLLILIVRYLCLKWTKGRSRKLVMPCFWGAAWMLLAVGTTVDYSALADDASRLAACAIMSALWCVLCVTLKKVKTTQNSISKGEYNSVAALQINIPRGLAVVTLLLLLFR